MGFKWGSEGAGNQSAARNCSSRSCAIGTSYIGIGIGNGSRDWESGAAAETNKQTEAQTRRVRHKLRCEPDRNAIMNRFVIKTLRIPCTASDT